MLSLTDARAALPGGRHGLHSSSVPWRGERAALSPPSGFSVETDAACSGSLPHVKLAALCVQRPVERRRGRLILHQDVEEEGGAGPSRIAKDDESLGGDRMHWINGGLVCRTSGRSVYAF
ncbi:MAG: hypothetical protein ACJATT_002876 [Myxococcota bacterium]|jgi:hypothetical protein